ncbi:MAG: carotenoid biosynthesis protein [Myxococcota bacterium]|nr:carotenoid biosynthesis protein [Myxococcota bacterium]
MTSALWWAWCLTAILFTAVALVRVLRRSRLAPSQASRRVLLLRPVDAPSPSELENLSVSLPGVEQVVVSSYRLRLPDAVRWLPSDPPGFNRKLGHLKYALAVREEVTRPVLVVDADVRVDTALVDSLLSALESGAALAWAAPRPSQRGVERGLLVQSVHSFEVLEEMSLGSTPLCGKAMALGPQACAVLATLPDCLGEDLELSRALSARGLPVRLAGEARMPARVPAVARYTRWMQVLRAHRPALFPTVPLLFACTPPLLLVAAVEGSLAMGAGGAVLVLLRATLASVLERRPGVFLGWLGAELLLLWCWCRALVQGSRVVWRGRPLVVGAEGRLGVAR